MLNLKPKVYKNLWFFKVRVLGGMYISERLKEALEEAKVTGIRIMEAKNPEIIVKLCQTNFMKLWLANQMLNC